MAKKSKPKFLVFDEPSSPDEKIWHMKLCNDMAEVGEFCNEMVANEAEAENIVVYEITRRLKVDKTRVTFTFKDTPLR